MASLSIRATRCAFHSTTRFRDTNAPADASFTRFLAHSGTALKEIVHAMGLPERFYERYRHYARLNEHRVQVVPGIQDLLTELRATDSRLGLVTGKEYDRTCGILNRFDLSTTFDCIIGGDQIRRSKPDPEGVEVAMLFLSAARRTTLFVGDTPNDVIAARRARVDTVGVGWGLSRPPSLRKAGATYVVNTVDRLRALVGRLARGES